MPGEIIVAQASPRGRTPGRDDSGTHD
jgi:hypothetical protein